MSLLNSRAVAVVIVTCATFTDIVAYSIAVPVLPDLSRRLGATPTTIGLLFGSFGVTPSAFTPPAGPAIPASFVSYTAGAIVKDQAVAWQSIRL